MIYFLACYKDWPMYMLDWGLIDKCEVISNIHENLELLGETK